LKTQRIEGVWIPLGLYILGAILRLIWGWNAHAPTLDTAIVGLMAMDIQEGARPLFFTGQGYMGALEAYLTAGVFELFGTSPCTMSLVPSLFGAGWSVLLYFFLKQDVPWKGALAGSLLVAFPAQEILWYTTVPYGGYPEMYIFGMVMILHAALRLKTRSYAPVKDALFFSLVAFLGAWTNLQVFPFIGVAGLIWLFLLIPNWRTPKKWLPFAWVLIALALAVIPQILLSNQNPSSPPLFEGISLEKLSFSIRGLFRHNLKELVWWRGQNLFSPTVYALPYILFILTGTIGIFKKPTSVSLRGLALCGLFVVLFSILYFPHPMAGFIPRYVIAPFVLICSIFLSLAISSSLRPVSIVAQVSFGGWLLLQLISYPISLMHYQRRTEEKITLVQEVIEVARSHNLTHLRMVGSEMEGHRMSAFTFQAGKSPTFTSSYDERRRGAQLAWYKSPQAGYLFPKDYEPFIKGSLSAMGIPMPPVTSVGRFNVMRMPTVPMDVLANFKRIQVPEALDLNENPIRITFDEATKLNGLRLTVGPGASLPYQYEVRAGRGGQVFVLAKTQKRLGTSYVSGDRVYFKGFQNQMDIFWPAQKIEWVEFSYVPGHLNREPVELQDMYLFGNGPQMDSTINVAELEAWLDDYPDAKLVASDGVVSMLWREGFTSDRLPLPWNPRNLDAQPLEFSLKREHPYLILTENRFSTDETSISFGPIQGIYIENTNRTWKRFMLD